MSEPIDKEPSISTIISATGAWLGLGAGVCLLAFAFLVVLKVLSNNDPNRDLQTNLRYFLSADLASAERQSIEISDDGQTLKILRATAGTGALEPVVYNYSAGKEQLYRDSGKNNKVQTLGSCSSFHFAVQSETLIADYQKRSTSHRGVWSLQRWSLP